MGVIAAIITIGILVTAHELGHFITAKMTGMRVDEFAIGFGPALWKKKKGETLYSLRCIPLGGYNKIAGMEPGEEITPDGYNSKSIPARLLVVVAGALMNFLLPVFLFAGISYVNGVEDVVNKAVLGTVRQDGAAYQAGLRVGDKLLTINGKTVTTWDDVIAQVKGNGEKRMVVTAARGKAVGTYTMQPRMNTELKRAIIGIQPEFAKRPCGLLESLGVGARKTFNVMAMMLNGLYQIVNGTAPADLSGPIGVAVAAGEVAAKGFTALLNFVCFLSINLGIINLLPLPALDGGHVVLLILEAVRGKSLPVKTMEYIQYVGISILLFITFFSTYRDLLRF